MDGDGVSAANALTFSADGQWVFATAAGSSALTWFARDPESGRLEQRGCLKNFAWPGERCATVPLLGQATGVAVSPDGTLVFVTAPESSSLTVFRRDPQSGHLERLACISDTGSDGLCANGVGLRGANHVVATPDGGAFVLAQAIGAVTSFAVDPSTGMITQRGCLASGGADPGQCKSTPSLGKPISMALSPDGRDLYVGAQVGGTLTALHSTPSGSLEENGCFAFQGGPAGDSTEGAEQDSGGEKRASTDGCTPARALTSDALTVSADGSTLFAAGVLGLGMFRRDPATGRLEWLACIEQAPGTDNSPCTQAHSLFDGITGIAASADGGNLYLASAYGSYSTVEVFAASLGVARSAHVGTSGRARLTLSCPETRPVACVGKLRQRGRLRWPTRYRLATGAHMAVPLHLRPGAARHVRARRLKTITITVTDTAGLTRATRHHIALQMEH
jgi:hypothetical protein